MMPHRSDGFMCRHESRGGSECLLDAGHDDLHSDLTLLWNDKGELCNLDGQPIAPQEGRLRRPLFRERRRRG